MRRLWVMTSMDRPRVVPGPLLREVHAITSTQTHLEPQIRLIAKPARPTAKTAPHVERHSPRNTPTYSIASSKPTPTPRAPPPGRDLVEIPAIRTWSTALQLDRMHQPTIPDVSPVPRTPNSPLRTPICCVWFFGSLARGCRGLVVRSYPRHSLAPSFPQDPARTAPTPTTRLAPHPRHHRTAPTPTTRLARARRPPAGPAARSARSLPRTTAARPGHRRRPFIWMVGVAASAACSAARATSSR